MTQPFVSILMGSDSDLEIMQHAADVLKRFNIEYKIKISSAHRTPIQTHDFVKSADESGCAVFICGAGLAAHLAGAVAANTIKPVIGVPLPAHMHGIDALLSTVQMPAGIPVATVAIGKTGAKNAGMLAVQIMALADENLAQALRADREAMTQAVLEKDRALQASLVE